MKYTILTILIVLFYGVKYIHIAVQPPTTIHLQNYFIVPKRNSIPTKFPICLLTSRW